MMMWRYMVAYDRRTDKADAYGPYVTGPLDELMSVHDTIKVIHPESTGIYIIEREGADSFKLAEREVRIAVKLGHRLLSWDDAR